MAHQSNMGAKMLETTDEKMTAGELELVDAGLTHLSHEALLNNIRQINGKMTRELMNSPDTLRIINLDEAPVPINPRRFCELMAPYLCMN
ncbi:MAG: hypothetical protein O7D35_11190 [Acidobacteria bacterium]|nr:hypothetical protein [Acidobacteriota bacterium]